MRTIEEVLNEMIGVNWMITQKQVNEIQQIHAAEKDANVCRIREAYEAGRKHDREGLEEIIKAAGGENNG